MLVDIKVRQQTIEEIKQIEVDFPIYKWGTGNYKQRTKFKGSNETTDEYFEIVKIISPIKSIQIEKKINYRDSEVWTRYEVFERVEEPYDSEGYYKSEPHEIATVDDWNQLMDEYIEFLTNNK